MLFFTLDTFNNDDSFPFFIQFGHHDENLYIHSHDNFSELVIVTEGSATHIVDNELYRIHKGDVFVINNDTAHGFSDTKNLKLCNIMFRPSFWTDNAYDVTRTAGFQALFFLEPQYSRQKHFCSRLKLSVEEYIEIFSVCNRMHSEYINRTEGWETSFISGFLQLVTQLSRLYSFDKIESTDSMLNLAKAISYIENNYTQDISVELLARLSNYSQRQFIRIFKSIYNCKPTEYIRHVRIKAACNLLADSRISITDCGAKAGFDDSNYFSRVFKLETGISPREYRNKTK